MKDSTRNMRARRSQKDITVPTYISGHEKVTGHYGWWPTFHDAEILEIQLTRDGPACRIKLFVYDMYRAPNTREWVETEKYANILFQFNDVVDIDLKGFNEQNVLSRIDFNKVANDIIEIRLPSIYGLNGSIRCKKVEVVDLEPLEHGDSRV